MLCYRNLQLLSILQVLKMLGRGRILTVNNEERELREQDRERERERDRDTLMSKDMMLLLLYLTVSCFLV